MYAYIQGVSKKDTTLIVITASDFKIQTFTNHSKKEVSTFSFDALLRPFRETHRVKGCDKNVSLFLIVRRKMAYLLISLNSFGIHSFIHSLEFIWPPTVHQI